MEVKTEENSQNVATEQASEGTQNVQTDDLVSRVSSFVETNAPENKTDDQIDTNLFNDVDLRKKIDSIEDSELKDQMIKLRKSIMTGANEKFKDWSELKKEVENLKQSRGGNGEWTPERIQNELLNDSSFLEAAQKVQGVSGDNGSDPLEYADEGVKNYIKGLEQKLNALENRSKQTDQEAQKLLREQQHAACESKYKDYDRNAIDTWTADAIAGKVSVTTESIYKAMNHDVNVKKAYKMGWNDRDKGLQENSPINTIDEVNTSKSMPKLNPEKNETSKAFWDRLVSNALKNKKS